MAAKKKVAKKATKSTAKKGRKGGMSSTMIAGVAGAVVGAALGGASAAALAHGRTRKALTDTAGDLTEYAGETMKENRQRISDITGAVGGRSKRSTSK